MSNGIEIHFDEKWGCLELACEPEAFAPYLDIAREQLMHFPEIDMEKVIELNVIDTESYVARRDAPRKMFGETLIAAMIGGVVVLALIGFLSLVSWLFRYMISKSRTDGSRLRSLSHRALAELVNFLNHPILLATR